MEVYRRPTECERNGPWPSTLTLCRVPCDRLYCVVLQYNRIGVVLYVEWMKALSDVARTIDFTNNKITKTTQCPIEFQHSRFPSLFLQLRVGPKWKIATSCSHHTCPSRISAQTLNKKKTLTTNDQRVKRIEAEIVKKSNFCHTTIYRFIPQMTASSTDETSEKNNSKNSIGKNKREKKRETVSMPIQTWASSTLRGRRQIYWRAKTNDRRRDNDSERKEQKKKTASEFRISQSVNKTHRIKYRIFMMAVNLCFV